MSTNRITIPGEPASKSNSRRKVRNRNTGKTQFIKSDKALRYASVFKQWCMILQPKPVPVGGDVVVYMKIFYSTRRPDLDETLILDLLQGVLYINDRQVKERHTYWGLDRDNPRTVIEVRSEGLADQGSETPWVL